MLESLSIHSANVAARMSIPTYRQCIVQEAALPERVALQFEYSLQHIHLDAASRHVFDQALKPTPQRRLKMWEVAVCRFRSCTGLVKHRRCNIV